jgi:hypothetical protein
VIAMPTALFLSFLVISPARDCDVRRFLSGFFARMFDIYPIWEIFKKASGGGSPYANEFCFSRCRFSSSSDFITTRGMQLQHLSSGRQWKEHGGMAGGAVSHSCLSSAHQLVYCD